MFVDVQLNLFIWWKEPSIMCPIEGHKVPSTLLSGFFFATSVGDILNLHITLFYCTLSWRMPEVYQREPPDRMILTAMKAGAAEDSEPHWKETVTDFRREECSFKVKPKDVISVTLTIIHNKGLASAEAKACLVPGTYVYMYMWIIVQFCIGTPNNYVLLSQTVTCA